MNRSFNFYPKRSSRRADEEQNSPYPWHEPSLDGGPKTGRDRVPGCQCPCLCAQLAANSISDLDWEQLAAELAQACEMLKNKEGKGDS